MNRSAGCGRCRCGIYDLLLVMAYIECFGLTTIFNRSYCRGIVNINKFSFFQNISLMLTRSNTGH